MATWWTCSAPTAPRAPRFLLPRRESTCSHPSPRTLPLPAAASSAPSPVPWSKPRRRPRGWSTTRPAPRPPWHRNPRSSWWSTTRTQTGKSSLIPPNSAPTLRESQIICRGCTDAFTSGKPALAHCWCLSDSLCERQSRIFHNFLGNKCSFGIHWPTSS